MLASPRRHLVATLSALLLATGLVAGATSPSTASDAQGTISGTVTGPAGESRQVVVAFLTEDRPGTGEWRTVKTAYPNASTGAYSVALDPATYIVGFNQMDTGRTGVLDDEYFNGTQTQDLAERIVVTAGSSHRGTDASLDYAGGMVTGTVKDSVGNPLRAVEVTALWDELEGRHGVSPSYREYTSATTNARGEYRFRTNGHLTLVQIEQDSGGYVLQFYKNSSSVDDPSTELLSVSPGQTIPLDEIVLKSQPLWNRELPRVNGSPHVGTTLRADPGLWTSRNITFRYQWFRVIGSKEIMLSGATKPTYKPVSKDLRRRILVKVTATQPGTPAVTATSRSATGVKRGSSVSLSVSSPSKNKVKASIKVKVTGLKYATGKVTVSCGRNRIHLYVKKSGSVKRGKAAVTLSSVPRGNGVCQAVFKSTSSVSGSETSWKKVKVR